MESSNIHYFVCGYFWEIYQCSIYLQFHSLLLLLPTVEIFILYTLFYHLFYHFIIILLFILLLKNIECVISLRLLWCYYEHYTNISFYTCVFISLVYIYLRVQLPSCMVCIISTGIDNAKLFSKQENPMYAYTSSITNTEYYLTF